MEKPLQILSEIKLSAAQWESCPIAISTLRVAYDYTYNREVLFALCENRAPLIIRSVYFDLVCFDDAGDRLGIQSGACMRGLDAASGIAFGENAPIVISFAGTCKVEIALQKVVFADGSVWRMGDALPEATTPEAVLAETVTENAIASTADATENIAEAPIAQADVPADAQTAPQAPAIPPEWLNPPATVEGYRAAAQGLASLNDPQKSYLIKKFTALGDKLEAERIAAEKREEEARIAHAREEEYRRLSALEPSSSEEWEALAVSWKALGNYKDAPKRSADALKKVKSLKTAEKRNAAKEAELARIAAEQKAAKKRAQVRAAIWIGSTVLVVIALTLLTVLVAIPASRQERYKDAEALLAEGKYTEAIAAFQDLGDYADSSDRIRQIKVSLTGREDALFQTSDRYPCYSIENGVLSYDQLLYRINATEIRIPDYFDDQQVVALSSSFFSGMEQVEKIILPPSVKLIGDSVFADCIALTYFEAPGLVTAGNEVFRGCTALTEITLPDTLTSLGSNAFQGCTALQKVVLPEGLRKLSSSLFLSCNALRELQFSSRLLEIGDYVFAYCTALPSVTIPDSVTSIGTNAFLSCTSFTEMTIPDSVTMLGDKAFGNCSALSKVTLGSKLTKLAPRTFIECSALTEISLPTSLTQIGYSSFEGCTSLSTVRYNGSESDWAKIDLQNSNDSLTSAQIQFGS